MPFDASLLVPDAPAKSGFDPSLLVPDAPPPKPKANIPRSNPRPLAGRVADFVSSAIGDPEGYGLAGLTKTASLGLGNIPKAAGIDVDVPALNVTVPPSTRLGEGMGDFVKGSVEGLTTPSAASLLAQGPVGASQLISQMAVDAPDKAAEFGKALGDGDARKATSSLLGYLVDVAAPAGMAGKLNEPQRPLAPPITGASLPPPVDATATPPKKGAKDLGRSDIPVDLPPSPAKPVIPETPPEPERGLTVIQEIRQRGLDTKKKIQSVFPHLSLEEAGALRKLAYPEGAETGTQKKGETQNETPVQKQSDEGNEPSGQVEAGDAEKAASPGGQVVNAGVSQSPQITEVPAASGEPSAPEQIGGNTYGIANRVNEARAARGDIAPVATGTTLGPEDSIEAGRAALASGADPQKVLADFNRTKRFNAADVGVVRAHGEQLAKAADAAFDAHGDKSPEYQAAKKADEEWAQAIQPIKTEWSGSGQAMQGETDIDTGSFHALSREFEDVNEKPFTPKQAAEAKGIATASKAADAVAADATQKLFSEAVKPEPVDPQVKSIVDRVIAALDKQADAARLRLKGKLLSPSPGDFSDLAIIGASHIAHGLRDFAAWSKKMTDEFSDKITPHLQKIWEDSNKTLDTHAADKKVSKAIKSDTSIWAKAKPYIDQGLGFDDIRNRLATDLGISVADATKELTKNKTVKRLADDAWLKQKKARELKSRAKRWLADQSTPAALRALQSVPRALFTAKVFGHGLVAFGTHAPMVAFQPKYWASFTRDYAKMAKMNVSPAFYEMQRADLQRNPNYATAQRSGLMNNPGTYEDLDSPLLTKMFGALSGAGNRGYFALKLLRQDMFDQEWGKLPESTKTPEVAAAISDGINHATGITRKSAPKWLNTAFFAPRLEASRYAWLSPLPGGDPARAIKAFASWDTASEAEKQFAIRQVKEKAWVVGTALSMLAANQGVLSASGSKQKINFTDPMQSDFLKFKAAGMDFSFGNAMLSLGRLPIRLYALRSKGGSGKLAKLIYPDESMSGEAFKYLRTQFSPFASAAADIAFKGDYANRPLPKMPLSGPVLPVPNRLAKQGVKPYTWTEFLTEAALPIPFEEAAQEVFRYGLGMDDKQVKEAQKALATIAVMSATGGRLTEDFNEGK